jgi:hypothetical protein
MAASPAAAAIALSATTAAPAAVAATTTERAPAIQDRAFAALYPASEANTFVGRPLAQVRPVFRPAVAGNMAGEQMPQLLLDIATLNDESHQSSATPVPEQRSADEVGDTDAGDVAFGKLAEAIELRRSAL